MSSQTRIGGIWVQKVQQLTLAGERDELARLTEAAERLTIRDEEQQTIDLRLVKRD